MVDKRKIAIIVLECLMAVDTEHMHNVSEELVEGILVLEPYDVSSDEIICNHI